MLHKLPFSLFFRAFFSVFFLIFTHPQFFVFFFCVDVRVVVSRRDERRVGQRTFAEARRRRARGQAATPRTRAVAHQGGRGGHGWHGGTAPAPEARGSAAPRGDSSRPRGRAARPRRAALGVPLGRPLHKDHADRQGHLRVCVFLVLSLPFSRHSSRHHHNRAFFFWDGNGDTTDACTKPATITRTGAGSMWH